MNQTVLICDDTMFMRTMISQAMEAAGYEVVAQAETGTEAVKKYQEFQVSD